MGCGASSESSSSREKRTVAQLLAETEDALADGSKLSDSDLNTLRRIAGHAQLDLVSSAVARGAADQDLVRQSWMKVREEYGSATVGAQIFSELLSIQPMAIVAFHNVPPEVHARALGRMVDQVVQVESNSATVVPALLALGARHTLFGLEASILPDMKLATMAALNTLSEDGLSDAEVAAWDRVWGIVIDLMTHGMGSPTGLANRERYEVDAARKVQAKWQKIQLRQHEGDEDMRLFSRKLYQRVIDLNPEFARFSNLTDFRTAERIMQMLTTVIDATVQEREIQSVLRESGARHIAYGVTEEHMRAFEQPFLDTCELYLGAEEWDAPTRHLLARFWGFVCDGMIAGLETEGVFDEQGAPIGEMAIVFTDIEKSTRMWEAMPGLMGGAIDKHNRIARQLIHEHRGYEVKTIGDAFLVAFPTMAAAALFACALQTELLLQAPIAPGFKMVKPTQASGPGEMWDDATLRVRVGVEWCTDVVGTYDPVHRRVDYHGPGVNLASRVESAAAGGQVLMTAGAVAQLQAEQRDAPAAAPFEFKDLEAVRAGRRPTGEQPPLTDALAVALAGKGVQLKGVSEPVDLYTVMPMSLAKRQFRPVQSNASGSGSVANSSFLKPPGSGSEYGQRSSRGSVYSVGSGSKKQMAASSTRSADTRALQVPPRSANARPLDSSATSAPESIRIDAPPPHTPAE